MGLVVLALPADLVTIAAATFHRRAGDVRRADPSSIATSPLTGVEILVVPCDPRVLTAALVAACDAAGVRIAPFAPDPTMYRLAESFGLSPLAVLQEEQILALPVPLQRSVVSGGVTVVWGPHGAPGRSTIAASVAVQLADAGQSVALIDADSHAPSIAQRLGLSDDGPGFASVCRSAQRRALDAAELSRVSQPLAGVAGAVAVLSGINRPNRWPELSAERVSASLQIARGWADHIVVDVAASLEADEEIVSDIEGPRRNASTIASLQSADRIIAVALPDAANLARFIRAHRDVCEVVGDVPVHVVVNRLRAGVVGLDAKGQVRHTLSRFAGIDDVMFLPDDQQNADAALLHAVALVTHAPTSSFAAGIRRIAERIGEVVPVNAG